MFDTRRPIRRVASVTSTLLLIAFFGLLIHCLYLGYAVGDDPYEEQVWPSADGFAAWSLTLRITRWAWGLLLIAGLFWALLWASTLQWVIGAAAHAGSAWLLRELGRAERVIAASITQNKDQA